MSANIRYCSSCGSKAESDVQFCGRCGRPFAQTDLNAASPVAPPPGGPIGTPVTRPSAPVGKPVPPPPHPIGTPVARPAGPIGTPEAPTGGARSMGLFAAGCIAMAVLGILVIGGGGYFLYGYFHTQGLRSEVAEAVTKARVLAASDDPRQWQQGAVLLFETDMRHRQDLSDEDRAELRQLLNELHARLNPPVDRKETEQRLARAQSIADRAFTAAGGSE